MNRNIAYDGLRGWLLIIIACNHLYGHFVPQITRAPLGLVTAAEGFVFLSGFVAYFVYSRLAADPIKLRQKIWKRSAVIYGFHIVAIALTFTLVWSFPIYTEKWTSFFNAANWFSDPSSSIISALLLLEQPGYHDILILYLVPMLALPFAITALKNGKALHVALASFLVWVSAQLVTIEPLRALFPNLIINISYFDPFAWQIYFYMGVLLSFIKFDKNYGFNFSTITKTSLLSCALLFFMIKHWYPELLAPYLGGHSEASIIYQVNLLLLVYLFMLLLRHASWIFKLKYPVFLGQHALPVFSFHTIVIYFLLPWSEPYITTEWYWDVLICLFFVGLLAVPAVLDKLWRKYKHPSKIEGAVKRLHN